VDLLHYYQVDLRDLFLEGGELSPRYLLSLIVNLPLGSAYVSAQRGGSQYRGWNEDRYALVALINAVRTSNYLFVTANSDPKKSKVQPPEPYPTPDDAEPGARARRRGPPAPGSFAGTAMRLITRARKARKNV